MIPKINEMYELSFHLIHLLRIQPSEVNDLTVPESRSFINFYNEIKTKEKEKFEELKNQKQNSSTSKRKPPVRSARRRR